MKKVWIVTFLVYLFVSCSNIENVVNHEDVKRQFEVFMIEVERNMQEKNLSFFEKNMSETTRNRYIYQELQKIDFLNENIQLYVDKPEYSFPKIEGIVGIQYQERTEYYTIFYVWEKNHWQIGSIEERR